MQKYLSNDYPDYLPDPSKFEDYWACDIEGDLIPSTKVYCLCAVNVKTKEQIRLRSYDDVKSWINLGTLQGHTFIFHNGLGYDYPTLNSILGTTLSPRCVIDTMLMSMLFSPSLLGGHSLENWGYKLNYPKGKFDDFSGWSQEMEDYCMNDAEVCRLVFIALTARMKSIGFDNYGIELEHRSWDLIQKQKNNGFAFNIQEAHILLSIIRSKETDLAEQIHKRWPPELKLIRTFAKVYKKDGSFTKGYLEHSQQYERLDILDDGRYNAFDYVHFNVGSPPQRVAKLIEAGWIPQEFTKPSKSHPTGQPQATSDGSLSPSLLAFVDGGGPIEAKLIAKWIDYNSRGNMVNTWIEAYNEDTRCIHGTLWLANTLRYKHSAPNTARRLSDSP